MQGHAQKIKDLFEKKIPEVERMSRDDFEEKTLLHDDIPFNDKNLAYEVRLPKGWVDSNQTEASNYSLSNRLLGQLVLFYGPPRIDAARSKFTIMAVNMEYELDADQWFMQYALSNGYTLEGIRVYDKRKVEALHVLLEDGDSYVVRTVAQINGKRMIFAQYTVPVQYWEEEKVMSYEVMQSFRMLSPQITLIENYKRFQFLDLVEFKYPDSWKITVQPIKDTDRMMALLENIRPETKILDGQVYIEALSSYVVKDIEDEIQNVKRKLNKQGLLVGNLIEVRDDVYFHEDIDFGFSEVYDARDTENDLLRYELWITAMATKDYFFFLYLVTPQRDTDFYIWSRNAGAYKAMTKFIHPLPKEEIILDEDAPIQLE